MSELRQVTVSVVRLHRLLLMACVFGLGCATPNVVPPVERQEPPPVDARAMEQFQQRSDDAMLQAALARYEDGDLAGCHGLLERLLHRNPAHVAARLTLADLQLEQGNIAAAEQQLRWAVQQYPNNPQARHSLGMLLDASGRHDEALLHLREASRLDPRNALYAMCVPGGSERQ